jgi:hypothetical protein
MSKKCIYCKTDIDQGSVIDFCERCGVGVWGPKMFAAIKQNMEGARDSGDLFQGSVCNSANIPSKPQNSKVIKSLVQESRDAIEGMGR